MSRIGAILAAAGSSSRLGDDTPKQFQRLGTTPMFILAMDAVLESADEIVIAVPRGAIETARSLLAEAGLPGEGAFEGRRITVVEGGDRRQDSVAIALSHLSKDIETVLVHDAARPFATSALTERVIDAVSEAGAAVPVVPIPDTVKRVQDARVVSTADRSEMRLVQTPQGFRRSVIERAYRELGDADVTDEAQAVEQCGFDVTTVEGDPGNVKVTGSFDLELARLRVNRSLDLDTSARVGTGHDCHRLVEGRALVLGGVEIPFDKGLDGFSDADVVTHAICDALLGAAAQGDIGQHFPPGDPRFEGISSLKLLARVAEILSKRGLRVGNVDATIVAQAPRLSPFIDDMRGTLSGVLGIDSEAVSIKATTTEGMGPEGTGLAMSATAVAIVRKAGPGQ